jgi:hypothetical protein
MKGNKKKIERSTTEQLDAKPVAETNLRYQKHNLCSDYTYT